MNTNKKLKKSNYWVMVVEKNDVVPRRDPKKPNLTEKRWLQKMKDRCYNAVGGR